MPPQSIVLKAENPELLAYVDPKGMLDCRLARASPGSVSFNVPQGHVDKLTGGLLLEDSAVFRDTE